MDDDDRLLAAALTDPAFLAHLLRLAPHSALAQKAVHWAMVLHRAMVDAEFAATLDRTPLEAGDPPPRE